MNDSLSPKLTAIANEHHARADTAAKAAMSEMFQSLSLWSETHPRWIVSVEHSMGMMWTRVGKPHARTFFECDPVWKEVTLFEKTSGYIRALHAMDSNLPRAEPFRDIMAVAAALNHFIQYTGSWPDFSCLYAGEAKDHDWYEDNWRYT